MTVDQDAPADAPTMTITDTDISDNVAVRRGGFDGGPGFDICFIPGNFLLTDC